MSDVIKLAEAHRRKMEHMRAAVAEIDPLLIAYARQNGGRFIRYGSTAKGRAMAHSDVDIIADFPGEASLEALNYAEKLCSERNLKPDVRPSCWTSNRFTPPLADDGGILERWPSFGDTSRGT